MASDQQIPPQAFNDQEGQQDPIPPPVEHHPGPLDPRQPPLDQIRNEESLRDEQNSQRLDNEDDQQPNKQLGPNQFETVHFRKDEKGQKISKYSQIIEIVRLNTKKPHLGGYDNLTNSTRYFNAFAQTDQKLGTHKLKITRQTQTYYYTTLSTTVSRQIGTQMQRQGIYITKTFDLQLFPKPYFNSDMWDQRRNQAALYIQRMVRGWFARKKTKALRQDKEEQRQAKLRADQDYCKSEQIKHKKQIQRRKHPRTKEDFRILYEELQLWRNTQIQRIKENRRLSQQQKKRALKEVLDKETDLLQTIDRLKIVANKQNKEQKINKFLKAMSDPKIWKRPSDNRFTQVHTPFTIRAKQLMDIYKGLKVKNLSIDERLDVLLNTKWTVKQHESDLTRDIVELIDREANMLDRGRPQSSLQGLRKRLANLFLMFIQYPDFNPEAARFQKIPYEFTKVSQQK